ncbi:replication factor A [Haloglomus irregulare]|uniref:Replication factor A n=1 Tax=Haloglomus irregulare TaxID=2234134 RepID=A0A554MUB2_9EURY|nr:replication factor A [Haloglomus irregulare]TSD08722.1 replication factor A [Haloglomus irregulare]
MSSNATPAESTVTVSDADLSEAANGILEQFPDDLDGDLPSAEEVASRLDQMTNQYKVPLDEARRAAVSHYRDVFGLEYDDLEFPGQSAGDITLASVDQDEQWVDVTVKVVELWEPTHDSIDQVGLIGDESGRLKFTKWAKAELLTLEEGRVYKLSNVITSEYKGRYSINLNSRSNIEAVDGDIDVGADVEDVQLSAPMVAIQSGSGLIKRCPDEDCTRVLQNGRCSEHGDVEGEFDLRIKAVFDDGETVQYAIFDREATEAIGGITLEEAKEMAMDALDTSVVEDALIDALVGRYYSVEGPIVGRYLLVNEAEQLG